MNASSVVVIALFSALGGCASMSGERAQIADAEPRECKATAVYTVAEELRNQNRPGVGATGDNLAREQGAAGLAHIKVIGRPRALRSTSPGTGLFEDALRDC